MNAIKQTNCPACNSVLRFKAAKAGLLPIQCPTCGNSFKVRVGGSSIGPSPLAKASNPAQSTEEPVGQLISRIVKSELLTQAEIDEVISSLRSNRRQTTVNELASELVRRRKLTKFQAKEICAGRFQSLVLGNYVVSDKLGDGGMGTVVKAHHRRMDRVVALKLLSPELLNSPEAVRRFHREAKAAAKLDHHNIVTAYDADEHNGINYLVMQFVDGCDLSAIVRNKGPLAPELALNCIEQAARGLHYAHEHGIVHRDIKPSNLILDSEGTLRILDMGLARIDTGSPDQDQLTGSGMIMGTVDFMAPEQAIDTKAVDGRADIYSLGATLWFLLTGHNMYESETLIKKLMAHQNAAIPSLREACPAAPPELDPIFARMVAKQPEDRYPNMGEVLADLERVRSGNAADASIGKRNTNSPPLPGESARELLSELSNEVAADEIATRPRSSSIGSNLDATLTMQASMEDTERSLGEPPSSASIQLKPRSLNLKSPQRPTEKWKLAVSALVVLAALSVAVLLWMNR